MFISHGVFLYRLSATFFGIYLFKIQIFLVIFDGSFQPRHRLIIFRVCYFSSIPNILASSLSEAVPAHRSPLGFCAFLLVGFVFAYFFVANYKAGGD